MKAIFSPKRFCGKKFNFFTFCEFQMVSDTLEQPVVYECGDQETY